MLRIERLTRDNFVQALERPAARGTVDIEPRVRAIIDDVKERGDRALIAYTAKFDGVDLNAGGIRVGLDERDAALAEVPTEIIDSLRLAAARIKEFHLRQLPRSWMIDENGVMLGQRWTPISRVGLYVPGGLASYPSSVLMNAIPAQIAGAEQIALCVPPDKTGGVSKYVLAAAAVIGLREIYRVGGAQAIAALAYGTETIKRVDKITGPGNIYVATAKRMVVGAAGIDMVAGPTEIVVVADAGADPRFIAADMIAQAEHDPLACAVLLTDDRSLASAVDEACEEQLSLALRAGIAGQALSENGRIFICEDLDLAIDFVNAFAPEHLEIMTENARAYLPKIKNAGAVFLGRYTPEALGDYVAGSNHVLPTASTARFYSPLGVYDFIKWSSVLSFSKEAFNKLGPHAVKLADIEGLEGHGRSVKIRLEEDAR